MKTISVVFLASALAFAIAIPSIAQSEVAPPPAIYLPYGGKIVTEINVSDEDVLGIVKQSIPALADVAKQLLPLRFGENAQAVSEAIDVHDLMQAIEGITNVRIIIAKYPSKISPERFVNEFNVGVAKAGSFNKVLTDFGLSGGAAGLYVLPENAGCIAFAYDPSERTVYAARVVGGLDVPKLIKWVGNVAKAALCAQQENVSGQTSEEAPQDSDSAPEQKQ